MRLTDIKIEITSICNFDCSFCPSEKLLRKKQMMSLDVFFRIINEVAEKNITGTIYLHVMGEPMLHPQFCEIVQYIQDKGLKLILVTNGSQLIGAKADALLDLRDAQIIVSIQEADPEAYLKRTRGVMSYEQYLERLGNFLKRAQKVPDGPKIQIHYLSRVTLDGVGKILHEHKRMLALLNKWRGIMNLPPKRLIHLFDINKGFSLGPKITFHPRYWGRWCNQFLNEGEKVIPRKKGYCDSLSKAFAILADGTCTYCCADYEGKMNLGNINESTIEDVYLNSKSSKIRNYGIEGIMHHPLCQLCKGKIVNINTNREVKKKSFLADCFVSYYCLKSLGVNATMKRIVNRFVNRFRI